MSLTPEDITNTIGSPIANARKYWPLIIVEMSRRGVNKTFFQVATLATIGVECGLFKPVEEYGPWNYFHKYDNRKDLGNGPCPDGHTYKGRGFIQITGKHNYYKMSKVLGVDFVKNPEKTLEPEHAVSILIEYLVSHGIYYWAQKAYQSTNPKDKELCWRKVRRLVNGGYTHYDKFKRFVDAFGRVA